MERWHVYLDPVHGAHILGLHAALHSSTSACVCVLYVRVHRCTEDAHCHGRSSLTAGQGMGGVPLRDSITAPFVKQS